MKNKANENQGILAELGDLKYQRQPYNSSSLIQGSAETEIYIHPVKSPVAYGVFASIGILLKDVRV